MESNAVNSADLVNLCREIVIYLSDRDPAPRQVLLSLPCLTPNDLRAFEEAMGKTPIRTRGPASTSEAKEDEGETIGLASVL
ncbi:hypothetical protein F2Q69_00056161 [Brassica cretica]|nr:hypothetical protein F2Q69_00056161 [Brassica cretica]